MRNYDYKCSNCNTRFEVFQSIKDASLTVNPNCKGELKRIIEAGVGIIFNGSGFYQTDYKNKSSEKSKETAKQKAIKKRSVLD